MPYSPAQPFNNQFNIVKHQTNSKEFKICAGRLISVKTGTFFPTAGKTIHFCSIEPVMTKKKSAPVASNEDSTSLNKYISDSGFCSRREADAYISQGRVTINDKLAQAGNRVQEGDVVEIDGEPFGKRVQTIYMAFNKPEGVTCTTDGKDKNNIIDYIGYRDRIFPIGRLDKDSEGLIFLTNDGNIVNKILRAGNSHEKEYIVTVDKPVSREFVEQMSNGVMVLGTRTQRCKVVQEAKSVFRITLTQGLNRQIRRMCQALDYRVLKLKRVRIMNVHIGQLPSGHWRYLTPEEIELINKLVASSSKTEEASRLKPERKKERKPKEKPQAKTEEVRKPIKNSELKKRTYKDFRNKGKGR